MAAVSPFLAWIGSPCLRHCVHGASIGGEDGGGLWRGAAASSRPRPASATLPPRQPRVRLSPLRLSHGGDLATQLESVLPRPAISRGAAAGESGGGGGGGGGDARVGDSAAKPGHRSSTSTTAAAAVPYGERACLRMQLQLQRRATAELRRGAHELQVTAHGLHGLHRAAHPHP
jgi:hypothetical protein